MTSSQHPLSGPNPVKPGQENEQEFSSQLRTIEYESVERLVAADHSPKVVLRIIDQARALAETVFENNQGPGTRRVACHQGCSWCCHQAVLVTAPEALRIADYVTSMENASLRQTFIYNLRQLDKRTRGMSLRQRASLHPPCAFLVNGSCGIYPVRPLACAEFTSFDVQDCIRNYQTGFRDPSITCDKARKLVYHSVRLGMRSGLRDGLPESDTADLELTAAVADALRAPDAASQWLAGAPVFEKAHLAEDAA